jgi:hypothetical protein
MAARCVMRSSGWIVEQWRSVMLESSDGVRVLQIQHDRFYMNWRARGAVYPRFSGGSEGVGLMQHALQEYERFAVFCESRVGSRPSARRIELTKVDVLPRGEVWFDIDDLAKLVPITGTFGPLREQGRREIALRFVEHHDDEAVTVSLTSLLSEPGGEMIALHIETRVTCVLRDDTNVESRFRAANRTANRVFFLLVPDPQRFGVREVRTS